MADLPAVLQNRSKLFWVGLMVMAVSVAPLLLYIIFGPADGKLYVTSELTRSIAINDANVML